MAGEAQSDKFRKMLWPRIEDSASAMDAMRLTQWAALLIAIGYGLALVLAFVAEIYPDGTPIEDEAELYGLAFIYLVLIVIALGFWLLVRRGVAWAVVIVAAWGVLEAILKLLGVSGGGILFAILLLLFCVNGFRGWLGVRKFGKPGKQAAEPTASE